MEDQKAEDTTAGVTGGSWWKDECVADGGQPCLLCMDERPEAK